MTSLDQNFSDLANILMQRRQMQHQAEQQQFTNRLADMQAQRQEEESLRANRLSDLQYVTQARDQNYKQGLQNAMANPASNSVTSVTPAAPQLSLASLAPGRQLQPPQFQPDVQQTSPLVQAYHDGRVSTQTTQQTPGQAGAAFAMQNGKPEDAAKIINMDDVLAQYGAKVAAGQGDPQEYYKRKNDLDMYKQFLGEVTPLLKTAQGRQLAQTIGAKYQQMNPGNKSAYDVSTITTQNDSIVNPLTTPDGKPAGTLISMPDGSTHYEKPPASESAHNVVEIPSADGKTARKMQYNPQTQQYDIPLGPQYSVRSQVPNVNVRVNASSTDEVAQDAQSIMSGDLAPSALGKRNGHDVMVRAAVRAIDPNFNFTEAETKAKLQKSEKIQGQAGNAAILPGLIQDVRDSGKKLGYSDMSPVGKGQQWLDQLSNNPDYINYAAKRNDIIMRIGGVMRENGMTDQAQKLEENSAPRSMSPRAFDAWAQAQMSVLAPIMKKYTSQAQGKGTPMGQSGRPLPRF